MLFVPPCINKYYILDLQPENSLIRYTVEQGHRVFVMSWRNPDESMARLRLGRLHRAAVRSSAIEVVQRDHRPATTINTLGFCVGGTLLATALAVLAARGEQPAHSLTLLTTLLDFKRHRRARRLRRRGHGADARDDDRARRRPTAPACSRARNSPPRSASCAPTTWCGTTWSATTSRAKRRRRSTCCTGTATPPTCRARCTAGTCATPICRTSCANPASSRCAARRSTSAASTCRPTSTARAKTTSCRGRRPTESTGIAQGQDAASCSALRATSPA